MVLHTKISLRYFTNHRAAHVPLCVLWRNPCLRSLPTRATGSALCIMGGRLWFLGHVCSPYMCMGSSARRYGIPASQGQEPSNELTARTLLIPRINMLGLTTCIFLNTSASQNHHNTHKLLTYGIYTNVQTFVQISRC